MTVVNHKHIPLGHGVWSLTIQCARGKHLQPVIMYLTPNKEIVPPEERLVTEVQPRDTIYIRNYGPLTQSDDLKRSYGP